MYEHPVIPISDVKPKELLVFATAEKDATEYFGDNGFTPNTVVVITWEKMMEYSNKRAGSSPKVSINFSIA